MTKYAWRFGVAGAVVLGALAIYALTLVTLISVVESSRTVR